MQMMCNHQSIQGQSIYLVLEVEYLVLEMEISV